MGYSDTPGQEVQVLVLAFLLVLQKLVFDNPAYGALSVALVQNPINLMSKIKIISEIAIGMNWFHSLPANPMHLYLTPDTVALGPNLTAQICDYGLY